jgi:hypothetical protein
MAPMTFSRWLDLSSESLIAVALFAVALGTIIILASLADRLIKLRFKTNDDRYLQAPGERKERLSQKRVRMVIFSKSPRPTR